VSDYGLDDRAIGVTLLWKRHKLIATQQQLSHYYGNAIKDLICHNIIIKDVTYEQVYKFTYLGSLIMEDNEIPVEINERLAKGNRCYFSLAPILKS
jgi:hypothetical protein